MKTIDIPPVTGPGFAADAELDDRAVRVELRGTADIPAKNRLDEFITRLHRQAVLAGVSQVNVDFMKLDFMNSSCLKTMVSWIMDVRELPAASQYRICFRSNRDILWQRRSLNALKCFADAIVTIEA